MGQEKKYDVGIMGLWSGCNYCSIMTYYALNRVVDSMGKSILMIDKPILSERDVEREETHSRRFGREHYEISKQYRPSEMHELNDVCDTFILGSDQVWNYGISRNFGKLFYFDFAGEKNKKIAYAVSFGHGADFAPPEERKVISGYMSRLDGIAVREADGVRLCREHYGINAVQVLDPVFLADPKIYEPIIEKSTHKEEEPFIVTYILDPTPERCEAARHIAEKLGGVKIISLLDGLPWKFKENKEKTTLPNCIENLQVEDWLYYLCNAKFILTDSCHGASFALIFKKNFIAMTNKHRGVSRFKSLSQLFKFEDRLVEDARRILTDDHLLDPLDYSVINPIMEAERKRCWEWLKGRLEEPKASIETLEKKNKVVTNYITAKLDNNMCMGCGACASICPKDAITLEPDQLGYYRAVIDQDKCVNCGQCVKACPAYSLPKKENSSHPACYEFMAASDEVLEASSSGGAFAVLAAEAFRREGAIAGAAWREDNLVEHVIVENPEEIHRLQKSKYLQSYLGTTFRRVKDLAENGRFVLFSGCPCQVAGLRKFLGRDYENVLMVDILCSYAPSAGFFKKYLQDAFPQGVQQYQFRAKERGWNCECIKVEPLEGTPFIRYGAREDDYQRVYHDHTMCPPHCERCQYQSVPRYGDVTIGDFWGISRRDAIADKEKGVSVILCNNGKGKKFLASLPSNEIRVMKEVPLAWLGGNGCAINGAQNYAGHNRNLFYEGIKKMNFSKAVDYALKPNHGIYPLANVHGPLVYNSKMTHFSFDCNFWEEHCINGIITLVTKIETPPFGIYATMPLKAPLITGKSYTLKCRFKIQTTAEWLNFHIKDSGSKMIQIVYRYKVPEKSGDWVDIETSFVPDSGIYDEFMFGAAQLKGEGRYLAIKYVYL
ncbi:MAG: polysaccharide pyruvyl transferase family protein, partial [Selenomonas sp.]|nr:polysaccharide pyruvyl transferase family protein [Selenomonas sp.]